MPAHWTASRLLFSLAQNYSLPLFTAIVELPVKQIKPRLRTEVWQTIFRFCRIEFDNSRWCNLCACNTRTCRPTSPVPALRYCLQNGVRGVSHFQVVSGSL